MAQELKQSSKENRPKIISAAREKTIYQQTRKEKIEPNQPEESIDNGYAVLLRKKTLYHGSGTAGIEKMNHAEDDTVGSGIYFTSEPKDAIGYARIRSKNSPDTQPRLYEVLVENIKLMDLRKTDNVAKVLDGFKQVIAEKLKDTQLPYNIRGALTSSLKEIHSGKVTAGSLKVVTQTCGQLFSKYVSSLGYDGLITMEGGEGIEVEDHDSYVIFDPTKVNIQNEQTIK